MEGRIRDRATACNTAKILGCAAALVWLTLQGCLIILGLLWPLQQPRIGRVQQWLKDLKLSTALTLTLGLLIVLTAVSLTSGMRGWSPSWGLPHRDSTSLPIRRGKGAHSSAKERG